MSTQQTTTQTSNAKQLTVAVIAVLIGCVAMLLLTLGVLGLLLVLSLQPAQQQGSAYPEQSAAQQQPEGMWNVPKTGAEPTYGRGYEDADAEVFSGPDNWSNIPKNPNFDL